MAHSGGAQGAGFSPRSHSEAALSQQNPGQMIPVANTLKAKIGGRFGGIDPAALAAAEALLKGLAANFGQWMQDELTKLKASRELIRAEGYTAVTGESLYFRAHDLKS